MSYDFERHWYATDTEELTAVFYGLIRLYMLLLMMIMVNW